MDAHQEALQKQISFRDELAKVINKYSLESGSNTPDFILANYMSRCLDAFDQTLIERERWYGHGNSNNR